MATRIFHPSILANQTQLLSETGHHHVARVLRKSVGSRLEIFDGKGCFAIANIIKLDKKTTHIDVGQIRTSPQPKLHLHLFQALSKGDRLDFAIQKAVELGVNEITPFVSSRCEVRLNAERQQKKINHLKKIVESACEQSHQNYLPVVNSIVEFDQAIIVNPQGDSVRIILSPQLPSEFEVEDKSFRGHMERIKQTSNANHFEIWVGPEGGFTDDEIFQAIKAKALTWQLGPRILRTETAPLVALSILQHKLGDF